jgi:hypothetical protein
MPGWFEYDEDKDAFTISGVVMMVIIIIIIIIIQEITKFHRRREDIRVELTEAKCVKVADDGTLPNVLMNLLGLS